ncbi:MAG: hypothetical protein QOI62_1517 [Solirubrobacteraceae bacterium]|nr:hypothetical protein [Solirubrobacteraceae bacterium]
MSSEELTAEAEGRLEAKRQRDLDTARMWISADDGLLVRGVKPHSAAKSMLVSRGVDTVSFAMGGKWHGVHYLELYSGPGRLLDQSTGVEQVGSPLQALQVRRPFNRYVFSDYSQQCIEALDVRVGARSDVDVLCGDANDAAHLKEIAARLDPRALVVAYLDTARPQDLHWSTVEYLAGQFRFIDLIINLPIHNVMRAILGAGAGAGARGPGAAGRFLHHSSPHDLLTFNRASELDTRATRETIRAHYDAQLMALGFKRPARRTVWFPPGNPYYDVLLASRHQTGLDLWNKTNPAPENPQLSFLLDDAAWGA